MPIKYIEIRNMKSIRKEVIDLDDINFFLGHNGAGKSNILKAVNYFYCNLVENNVDTTLFDKNNQFNKFFEISIEYDFSAISKKINSIRSNGLTDQVKGFVKKYDFYQSVFSKDNKVKLTLRQFKDNTKEWLVNDISVKNSPLKSIKNFENHFFKLRALIKNMFPVYHTDVRNLNLTNWENIWSIVGDLCKVDIDDKDKTQNSIQEMLYEILGAKHKKMHRSIKNSLEENHIQLKEFNSKEQFSTIYKMHYNGEKFNYKNFDLSYFSDGNNSFNYLNVLISIISNISKHKLKEPLVIIDEPEMGLYQKHIDSLTDQIVKIRKSGQVIISTHSARMIRNIMKSECSSNVYHLILQNEYTIVSKMKELIDDKERYRITEKEASYYFSRGILFVEGETELEVFQNENLAEIFPILNKIDVSLGGANNIILNLSSPEKRNTNIPYLVLLDFDKILTFHKRAGKYHNKFTLCNSKINPLSDKNFKNAIKEKYLYGHKRLATHRKRVEIKEFLSNETFTFDNDWFYSNEDKYKNIKRDIKDYCLNYNVFLVDDTIEGSIININNHKIVHEWLKSESTVYQIPEITDIYDFDNNELYKTTALRLLHSGKYDNLTNIIKDSTIRKNPSSEVKKIYRIIHKRKKQKANGWIKSFFSFYFNSKMDGIPNLDKKKQKFSEDFPEIYSIISKLEAMLK